MIKKLLTFLIIVLFLTPNIVFARLPNDPLVEQWSYKDAKVYEAWGLATGSRDVVVAVIDNGFDTFHPDIYPNAWRNEAEIADNGEDDDKNGYRDDVWGWDFSGYDANHDGVFTDEELAGNNDPRPWVAGRQNINDDIHHGTLVAGIIGAVGDNNQLGAGVNWRVRLMNLKVLEVSGVGDLVPVTRAIYYAVDNGADVINISLVGDVDSGVKEAVKYAYDNGVVVIAASGNDRIALNHSPVYPVCADAGEAEEWVLGVTAIDEDHYLAPFSNTGSSCIDLTAPGVNVSSTMRYAPRYGLDKKYGDRWQGTSFAAPLVSAAAALIKSVQPGWGPKEIYEAILSTAHRTPPDDVAAYEEVYGAGLLQIGPAVDYALARVASGHALAAFLAVDIEYGDYEQNLAGQNTMTSFFRKELAGIDDVDSFAGGFATVKRLNSSSAEVNIFDENWQKTESWPVSARGKLDIEAGDVSGDGQIDIILAPKEFGKNLFQIFTRAGTELKKLDLNQAHRGVGLGLIGGEGEISGILALYNDGQGTRLEHYDFALRVERRIELSFFKNNGSAAAGDIDGDGRQEYIVGAGAGDTPYIAYYNADGSLKRKFYGYATDYLGGLQIYAGDYDRDGKDDVLAASRGKNGEVIIWNNRSRRINSWNFVSRGEMRLLPIYR